MKHIFLTGKIQIGKSTVIRKTLLGLNTPYGGFRTYFGPNRARSDRVLFIGDAAAEPVFDENHIIAQFQCGAPPTAHTDCFDTLGGGYIRQARQTTGLIVMDECGDLEREAAVFQGEIMTALDGKIPVLGVIKLAAQGWVDGIRYHPNVELITVDLSDRDALPGLLIGRYRELIYA